MNIDVILKNNKYKLLLNDDFDIKSNNDNICLISQDLIENPINVIKLPCGHTFDYKNLFNEIRNQKFYFYKIDCQNIKSNTIKCPYCRKVFDKLLPYHEIDNIDRIKYINCPNKNIMHIHQCEWKYKSGKNKDKLCSCPANFYKIGHYCETHYKSVMKKNNELQTNKCCAILKFGKRKGMMCGCNIKDNNFKYCKKHLNKEK
tara:strand:- start:116 stop:721 length:606 start_codon:yes stop_codon:yes gene_type:complete